VYLDRERTVHVENTIGVLRTASFVSWPSVTVPGVAVPDRQSLMGQRGRALRAELAGRPRIDCDRVSWVTRRDVRSDGGGRLPVELPRCVRQLAGQPTFAWVGPSRGPDACAISCSTRRNRSTRGVLARGPLLFLLGAVGLV